MMFRTLRLPMLAGALISLLGLNAASAQITSKAYVGKVYSLHTVAVGQCPSLDWHIVVGPNNTLSGMIGSDDMNVMFKVSGTYNSDGTFHLDGKEVGGTRTGALNGRVRRASGILVATLGGLPSDAPCQGKTVYIKPRVPQNPYDPTLSGGGGGAG